MNSNWSAHSRDLRPMIFPYVCLREDLSVPIERFLADLSPFLFFKHEERGEINSLKRCEEREETSHQARKIS